MESYTSEISDNISNAEQCCSARSLSSSINGGSSRFNLSSRSYDTSNTSIRHVNISALIENKRQDLSNDNGDCAISLDTRSNIVPELDLRSEENYPSTRNYTYSYRNHCDTPKNVLKPDKAYETWLSAKKKLISDEAARRRDAQEKKQKEMEERQCLAKEQYMKWLEKKSQTSITSKNDKTYFNLDKATRSKVTVEEQNVHIKDWERTKRLEEERRRMLKRQEQQRCRELEEQRHQMSIEAWKNWIANADKKPKPVPLNRGIFTLRGTVSDIFVNPNEWKSTAQTNNE